MREMLFINVIVLFLGIVLYEVFERTYDKAYWSGYRDARISMIDKSSDIKADSRWPKNPFQ